MQATEIIRKKRDGGVLSHEEIAAFVTAATNKDWPDYQISALLMAICIRGMNAEETKVLTECMVHSGKKLDLSGITGYKVDKHSTGGVGDKTSLIVAPLAAACGCVVPKMSGRGLGHTGGTLDKLESIPGFRVRLSVSEFRRSIEKIGCALIGQTKEIAPADKILYSLRDVTATVESIPLITASIMSKKIAEGIDGLVLDVKCGKGAFMKTPDDSRALARALVDTGKAEGLQTVAYLTAMDAPLGQAVGNSVEVIECLETLKGKGPKDLEDLAVLLASQMVQLANPDQTMEQAEVRVRDALTQGLGLQKLTEIIAGQGGDPRIVDDYSLLPVAENKHVIKAQRDGFVAGIDAKSLGRAAMALGAGRATTADTIDHGVGIILEVKLGQKVVAGSPLAQVVYRDETKLGNAMRLLTSAIQITEEKPAPQCLVLEKLV